MDPPPPLATFPMHEDTSPCRAVQLSLPVALYKCGCFLVQAAREGVPQALCGDAGRPDKTSALLRVFSTEPDFGRRLGYGEHGFAAPEYSAVFRTSVLGLAHQPLIDSETSQRLCDLLAAHGREFIALFDSPECYRFHDWSGEGPATGGQRKAAALIRDFAVTAAQRAELESLFGSSNYQRVELVFYFYNTQLQELARDRMDALTFVVNVLRQIVQHSQRPAHDLQQLGALFADKILDFSPESNAQSSLPTAALYILVYAVGIFLPSIFPFREDCGGALHSQAGPSVLEDLKLTPNSRIAFRSDRPLLQHLALPAAKSAVLIRPNGSRH